MKNVFIIILAALILVLLESCAMTVDVRVQRLPAMNTAGIRRLAIMPFQTSDNSQLQQETAQFITAAVTQRIMEANHFIMVDPTEIQRLQQKGESIENHVDAVFTGQIITLNLRDSSHREEQYNTKTGLPYYVTVYDRDVELIFSYSLKRSRDGSLIGVVTKQAKNNDSAETREKLRTGSDLLRPFIDWELRSIARDVAPYMTTETRTLMDEKSKNKILKTQMKDVYTIVTQGSYKTGLNAYLRIYEEWNNFAAGYNAAVLYEVLGDLENAIRMMRSLSDETGNPRAFEELMRLEKTLQDQETLAGVYQDSRSQLDKLIAQQVGLITEKLPKNAAIAVVNNSKLEADLADTIAAGLISGLQAQGIAIVDRNNTALLEAEKRYQSSGAVRDEDFVSIGNEAGVHIFVLIEITGTSNLRRLQVHLLDVERGIVIYQTPQSDEMNL